MSSDLDIRLHAYRPDLADSRLRDEVKSDNYVDGELRRVVSSISDMHSEPDSSTSMSSQILHGHDVRVYEDKNGWSYAQSESDGYVGYIRSDSLSSDLSLTPSHMVLSPHTYIYSDKDAKSPRILDCSIGSKLSIDDFVESNGVIFGEVSGGGYISGKHVFELTGGTPTDYVAIGERLLHIPYLWGGTSGFGIDCSGLIYLSHLVCGNSILRDTDMQESSLGKQLTDVDFSTLQRGDYVFWQGHVGMMSSADTLLHSNMNSMSVSLESLSQAISRIEPLYGSPTCVRRDY